MKKSISKTYGKKFLSLMAAGLMLSGSLSACALKDLIPSTSFETTLMSTEVTAPTVLTSETIVETEPEETEEVLSQLEVSSYFIGLIAQNLLGREVSSDEFASEAESLSTGAIYINDVVLGLVNGDEFSSLELNSSEKIDRLCFAILNYDPSPEVKAFLADELDFGLSAGDIANTLMAQDAFLEYCATYGFTTNYSFDPVYNPDKLYDQIAAIPESEEPALNTFGGYLPSTEVLTELNGVFEDYESKYYKFGFILIDVNTGAGISYNVDRNFYSASAIKGPYAISLAKYNQDAAENYENTIINMLVESDNDAFRILHNNYHNQYIMQWCEECYVDPEVCRWKYPKISCRDLTRIWVNCYDYLVTDPYGEIMASYLDHPTYSLIHSELGEMYTTWSKAGWLQDDDPSHTTTVDAGVVFAANGPYIVIIESTVPMNIDPLRPLMQALNNAHDEMIGL